jgi:histidinol-phosphate/aromatic aminotransferase/cobyric acid decarboxylase-like protein
MASAPVLERCIRVTVGTVEQRAIFADAFKAALDAVPE